MEVDLAKDVEYINNLANESQVYDLPKIFIKNNSGLITPKFESLFVSLPNVNHHLIQNSNITISSSINAQKLGIKILNDKIK